jgi:hypothetical protein
MTVQRLALALFCLCLLTPQAARAQDAAEKYKNVALTYEVYASGFHMFHVTLGMQVRPQDYAIDMNVVTQGAINFLLPWEGSYATKGAVSAGKQFYPVTDVSVSSWEKQKKTTEISYGDNGRVLSIVEKEDKKENRKTDIDEKLTLGTTDLMTAVLGVFRATQAQDACKGSRPVFDGKRRFNLVSEDAGRETLKKTQYSSFSGEALRCAVTIEPVAGFRKKDYKRGWLAVQEHAKAHKELPTMWLAPFAPGMPVVPVRMELASAYGSVIAHLVSAKAE